MNIKESLEQIGFFCVENSLSDIKNKAEAMVAAAGEDPTAERFEALPSFIPAAPPRQKLPLQLVIDIGGTSSKAGIRFSHDGKEDRWELLFEKNNNEFKLEDQPEVPIKHFASVLAQRIAASLPELDLGREQLSTCGIVWSNPLENLPLGDQGIDGIVTQRVKYAKGEWFNEGLLDGMKIGQIFLDAFNANSIRIKHFVITNDTPLTMKAIPDSNAGMVASTGLNGTIVKVLSRISKSTSDRQVICNAEMGRLKIADSLLSQADFVHDRKPANEAEYLSSGAFLPLLFHHHICTLAQLGCGELKQLAARLTQQWPESQFEFNAADLTCLLYDQEQFLKTRQDSSLYDSTVLHALREIAAALITRSAKLSSIIAYATVCNQLAGSQNCTVALDSRLAREIPLFWEIIRSSLNQMTPAGNSIKLSLVEPLSVSGGSISVPMQGAANALDSLL